MCSDAEIAKKEPVSAAKNVDDHCLLNQARFPKHRFLFHNATLFFQVG